ncbi:MAG: GNAT family N-acetyltransferase [Bacteroidetes bacterium]|nr:GNAT family N-acetyltransferase [Bacteroidota bacterium]MCH7770118.1 GNAT family N-acetyltransferase [Bacteroidota bacterium]
MIRKLKPDDVPEIESILRKIKNFSEEEVNVAMELVNAAASDPNQTDYNVFVYEKGSEIIGYHCTGKRPLTDAVYDLYWIVTNPDFENKGIGKTLIEHAENFVMKNKGRWLLAETSSRDSYEGTRNFYLRNNYSILSEINDFYSMGDRLIIFGKYFNNKQN